MKQRGSIVYFWDGVDAVQSEIIDVLPGGMFIVQYAEREHLGVLFNQARKNAPELFDTRRECLIHWRDFYLGLAASLARRIELLSVV